MKCPGAAAATGVQVRLPLLEGGWQTLPRSPSSASPSAATRSLRSGPRWCRSRRACSGSGCERARESVVDVDLDRGTVNVSRDALELPKALEQAQVDVTRAPDTDRLLAAAQLSGTSATVLQTLILATGRSTELARFQARLLGAESVVRAVAARAGLGGVRRDGAHTGRLDPGAGNRCPGPGGVGRPADRRRSRRTPG